MKIGIYDPYLDTLGGGERYCFDIATCLSEKHEVHIFWDDPDIRLSAEKRFGMSLTGVRFVPNAWKAGNTIKKARISRSYDAIFFVSDGSIPLLFSKKAFLIFQFPTGWVKGRHVFTQLKLRNITHLLCYSDFVKDRIDRQFGVRATVLPPAVEIPTYTQAKKEKLILSVGRFTTGMNRKKQEVLIQAFGKAQKSGLREWKLVLAGGMLSSDTSFVQKLKDMAKGFPIEILPNISHEELSSLYERAKIYWHAAGFGEDIEAYPERAEHFGITTIEAMGAAAVPIVYGAGGQKEIVNNGVNGYLWQTTDELIETTQKLAVDSNTWSRISQECKKRSRDFGYDRFSKALLELV